MISILWPGLKHKEKKQGLSTSLSLSQWILMPQYNRSGTLNVGDLDVMITKEV
jgi:hypothetical protein